MNRVSSQWAHLGWVTRFGWTGCTFILLTLAFSLTIGSFRGRSIVIENEMVPPRFPIVVVDPTAGEVLCAVAFFEDLPKALGTLGFVVDARDQAKCRSDVEAQTATRTWGNAAPVQLLGAAAEFSSISGGRTQEVAVSATWDDDVVNKGWYVASSDTIRPVRHQLISASMFMSSVTIGALAGIVLSRPTARYLTFRLCGRAA